MKNPNEHSVSRTFTFWIKTLAYLLSILLIFYAVPANVYAELIETVEAALDNASEETIVEEVTEETETEKAVFEVTDRREETVKHFRTEDGSFTAVQYGIPVHEKDENGEWQDIDNTLSDTGSDYATSNARVKFAKKTTGSETLFTLHDGNHKITMSLSGANKKVAGQVSNTQTEFPEDATQLQKMMTLDKLSSKILYPEILDGVDLEYVVESCNIKENIIVKERADSYSYTFEVQLNNLEAVLCEDGSVAISDLDTNEVVYTIPKGYMYDAAGEYSDTVDYSLTNSGNGKYSLTVTADAEWINDKDRSFPVTIDPTINNPSVNVIDAQINGSSGSYDGGVIHISGSTYLYWKSSLPSLPDDAHIVSAYLSYLSSNGSEGSVGAYIVNADWGSSGVPAVDTIPIAYHQYNFAEMNSLYHWFTWDITEAVTAWYTGTPNYGVFLRNMINSNIGITLFSYEADQAVCRPQFNIVYRDISGVESYWSYATQSAGLAGSGSVNYATGELIFEVDTLTTTDYLFGYTPALIYSSHKANQYNINENNENSPFHLITTAQGWHLSTDETIVWNTDDALSDSHYILTDSDGTEHYFTSLDNIAYDDEDGLNLTLYIPDDEQHIYIADSSNGYCYYTLYESTGLTAEGAVLTSYRDAYGNVINFSRNNGALIEALSITPVNSTPISYFTFHYDNTGMLSKIENSTRGRSVTFVYSDAPNGEIENGSAYLREIIYAHTNGSTEIEDARVSYTYTNLICNSETDDAYRLATAMDEKSGYRIEYAYDIAGRVCEITEYGVTEQGNIEGQSMMLSYENASTKVTMSGSDNIFGTDDDLFTFYIFDAAGRVISNYSSDKDIDNENNDRTIYGAVSGFYDTNEENPNRIKTSVVTNNVTTTQLINGDFHATPSSTSGTIPYWSITSAERMSLTFNNDSNKRGIVTFYPEAGTIDILSQTVRLTEGDYTLSTYYSTMNSSNVDVFLQVRAADTGAIFSEKKLSVSDVYVENNFDAITFSVDLPSGTAYKDYKICFTVKGNAGISNNACVDVDKIMLERGIGVGYFDLINAGHFESQNVNILSSTLYPVSEFWTLSSTYDATITDDGTLKLCAINSNYLTAKASQTIYTCTSTDIQNYLLSSIINGPSGYYIISGFGKSENASPNPSHSYNIGVEIDYYNRTSGQTETVDHTFAFYHGYDGWQYVQGSVAIDPTRFVKEIRFVCENSYNFGDAYFDNVSMHKVTDGSIVENEYYTSEDAAIDGLNIGCVVGELKLRKTPLKAEAYMYRSDHNMIKPWFTMDTDGNHYTYEYNVAGSPTSVLHTKYDVDNNMERSFLALRYQTGYRDKLEGSLTTYEYNNYGFATTTKVEGIKYVNDEPNYSLPMRWSSVYNCNVGSPYFGAISSETDPNGYTTRYAYDNYGRVTYTVNNNYEGQYYYYDDLDRITAVYPLAYDYSFSFFYANISGEMALYEYNDDGTLKNVSSYSTEYSYQYDAFGKMTAVSIGETTIATYEYYPNNGLLKKTTYGNGTTVENIYDKLDRLSEIWYTDSNNIRTRHYRYHYTKDGAVARVDDVLAETYTVYQYNTAGALTGITQADANNHVAASFVYSYNDENLLNCADFDYEYNVGNEIALGHVSYTYGYDDTDSLVRFNIKAPSTAADGYIAFEYDKLGRTIKKTTELPGYSSVISLGYTNRGTQYTTALLSSYTSTVNGTTTTCTYTYDPKGNITHIADSNGYTIKYTYDDQNQLTREDNPFLGKSYVYTYDRAGNRTSKKTYAYNPGTLGTATATQTLTYSTGAWGDQLANTTYDASGNPLTYNGYAMTWDGRQLTQMSMAGGQFVYSFTYNAEGIRTSKNAAGSLHVYTLEGSMVVMDSWGTRMLLFLYDESGSPIGLQYRETSYPEGVFDTYYFEKNLFDDIVAVYNASGTKIGTYTYDAWGNCTTSTTSASTTAEKRVVNSYNPFRYRGYFYDTETGLYYLQSRYYNPATGRFVQPQNVSSLNQESITDLNLYIYVNNSPIIMRLENGGAGGKFFSENRAPTLNLSPNINLSIPIVNIGENINFNAVNGNSKNYLNIHWDHEWLDSDLPSFLTLSRDGFEIINWGMSFYTTSLYFDNNENHSLYACVGNFETYAGITFKDGIGIDTSLSVLEAGYDGRIIDVSVSFLTLGITSMYRNGEWDLGAGSGFFGISVSINFGELIKLLLGI